MSARCSADQDGVPRPQHGRDRTVIGQDRQLEFARDSNEQLVTAPMDLPSRMHREAGDAYLAVVDATDGRSAGVQSGRHGCGREVYRLDHRVRPSANMVVLGGL